MSRTAAINNSQEMRMRALQQLQQYKGVPLVLMYKDNYNRFRIIAGGKIVKKGTGRFPGLDKKTGQDITELVAIVGDFSYDEDKGLKIRGDMYDGNMAAGKNLIQEINKIAFSVTGSELFNPYDRAEVNGRGTVFIKKI